MKTQRRQLLTLTAFVLTCTVAHAQCYFDPYTGRTICPRQCPPYQPIADAQSPTIDSSAHCRISVADGTVGSGTLVGGDDAIGLVLTCSHLFNTSKSQIIVSFPNGKRFGARLVEIDKANDLAALAIRRPVVEPLEVDESEPAGTLTACGFGPNGVFRSICGAITGHPTASGATAPSTMLVGAVRPGDSGGGVLNTRGRVVGVVWGQRDGQTYATCGRPVYDFLACVRGKLFGRQVIAAKPIGSQPSASPVLSPSFDWQSWTSELDARIRALDVKKQDKGDYLRPGDLNRYIRVDDASKYIDQFAPRSEVEAKLTGIAARFDSIHDVVESVRTHVEQISQSRSGILAGVSLGKVAVGALGLSGPVAAAVLVAGGLFGGRIKSRLSRLEKSHFPTLNPQRSTLHPVPIAVDSLPPPQQTFTETHYVPVEQDTFAKAHQWASEQVVRKYPGATEVLQSQESLIKQYLAAK
jgi:hypothetical protein